MEKGTKSYKFFNFLGPFLIIDTVILFLCYLIFNNLIFYFSGVIFGITGIILLYLFKKIKEEPTILSVILFILSGVIPIINIPEIIAKALMFVCLFGVIYLILVPPKDKNISQKGIIK